MEDAGRASPGTCSGASRRSQFIASCDRRRSKASSSVRPVPDSQARAAGFDPQTPVSTYRSPRAAFPKTFGPFGSCSRCQRVPSLIAASWRSRLMAPTTSTRALPCSVTEQSRPIARSRMNQCQDSLVGFVLTLLGREGPPLRFSDHRSGGEGVSRTALSYRTNSKPAAGHDPRPGVIRSTNASNSTEVGAFSVAAWTSRSLPSPKPP